MNKLDHIKRVTCISIMELPSHFPNPTNASLEDRKKILQYFGYDDSLNKTFPIVYFIYNSEIYCAFVNNATDDSETLYYTQATDLSNNLELSKDGSRSEIIKKEEEIRNLSEELSTLEIELLGNEEKQRFMIDKNLLLEAIAASHGKTIRT